MGSAIIGLLSGNCFVFQKNTEDGKIRTVDATHIAPGTGLRFCGAGRMVSFAIEFSRKFENPGWTELNAETASFA
jgi:hypothetical protein